jgi:hypothetical protein
MAQPPRMLLLDGGSFGGEAFVTLPTTYDVSPFHALRDVMSF